jgi:hypothetical protein
VSVVLLAPHCAPAPSLASVFAMLAVGCGVSMSAACCLLDCQPGLPIDTLQGRRRFVPSRPIAKAPHG